MYGHLLSMHGVSRPGKEVVLIGFNIDVKRSAVFCVKGKPIDGHFMEEFEHILEDDDIVDLMENQEIILVSDDKILPKKVLKESKESKSPEMITLFTDESDVEEVKSRKVYKTNSGNGSQFSTFKEEENMSSETDIEVLSPIPKEIKYVSIESTPKTSPIEHKIDQVHVLKDQLISDDKRLKIRRKLIDSPPIKKKYRKILYHSTSSDTSCKDDTKSETELIPLPSSYLEKEFNKSDDETLELMGKTINSDKESSQNSSNVSLTMRISREEETVKSNNKIESGKSPTINGLSSSKESSVESPKYSGESKENSLSKEVSSSKSKVTNGHNEEENFSLSLISKSCQRSIAKETPMEERLDSDYEEGDSIDFTTLRIQRKKLRHDGRNEENVRENEMPTNQNFIQDFISFMRKDSVASENSENSTINKCVRNLFTHPDSFLQHEISLNPEFTLEMLRSFNDDNFKPMTTPGAWIIDSCGRDGSKAIERLKSHSYLRNYIEFCVDSYDGSAAFQEKKQLIKTNLSNITKQVTNGKMYKRYGKLANNHKQDIQKADKILNPSKVTALTNCVRVWYNSTERAESDREFEFLYQEAMNQNYISQSNLTRWSQYARINLVFSDRSRNGAYRFTVQDYLNRTPQW